MVHDQQRVSTAHHQYVLDLGSLFWGKLRFGRQNPQQRWSHQGRRDRHDHKCRKNRRIHGTRAQRDSRKHQGDFTT